MKESGRLRIVLVTALLFWLETWPSPAQAQSQAMSAPGPTPKRDDQAGRSKPAAPESVELSPAHQLYDILSSAERIRHVNAHCQCNGVPGNSTSAEEVSSRFSGGAPARGAAVCDTSAAPIRATEPIDGGDAKRRSESYAAGKRSVV